MHRTPTAAVAGRSRGREHPCDVPAPPHSFTYSRFYPCGWRCDRHSPAAMAVRYPPHPRQETTDG